MHSLTYPESLRDAWSKQAHEVNVLFPRHGRFGLLSLLLVLKDQIVTKVRRSQPDYLGNINMPVSSFERAATKFPRHE